MSQKRTYDDGDSDYQQFGTVSGQQAKRQKLLELDGILYHEYYVYQNYIM